MDTAAVYGRLAALVPSRIYRTVSISIVVGHKMANVEFSNLDGHIIQKRITSAGDQNTVGPRIQNIHIQPLSIAAKVAINRMITELAKL